MDLSDFYPVPADLVQGELAVLDYLRNSPYIREYHPQVARDAAEYYPRNRNSRSGFEFNSFFDVCHSQIPGQKAAGHAGLRVAPNVRLTVSARIDIVKNAIADVSYCLSVCRMKSIGGSVRLTVLRKFHFDVVGGSGAARSQQHPRCHLQYCGEIVPYMSTVGCREAQLEQMHPWLSEPRILYWPMSLALLIDMALHEFPDQRSARFRADNYWRGLVHSHEELLLRPFYEKCVDVIANGRNGNLTLADAFYVS